MRFIQKLQSNGWSPHAGQLAYLQSNARFRVLACGRRWGKTEAAAADIARRIFDSANSKQIAIAPTLTQVKIVFEQVKKMLKRAGITFLATTTPHPMIRIYEDGKKTENVLHVLDARSGHDATNLRGEGADHVLIDEAAFIPESLITEVAMPMLAANNGRMSLLSTPRGRNHFYRFFAMGQRSENGFWSRHSPSRENPLVGSDYLEVQKHIISERAFRTEYGAEFVDVISTVFSIDALDAALMAPFAKGPIVVGVDWGRYHDYTAAVAVKGSVERAEVVATAKWNALSWSEMTQLVASFAAKQNASHVICDGTGGGDSTSDELQKLLGDVGFEKLVFTRQTKTEMVERTVRMLELQNLRLPAEPDLLREMEAFQAEADEHGVRYGAEPGMHDDLVSALVLACSKLADAQPPSVLMKPRRTW